MALLTADDVLNKKFQATKFREGYDQDEVDDFLDEVVNTLRETQSETRTSSPSSPRPSAGSPS
jgi:DivIVA domain-containing protein